MSRPAADYLRAVSLLALQESVGTGELIGSNADLGSEVASALPRGGSVEAMSARSGLPNDFFEVSYNTHLSHCARSSLQADPSACPAMIRS